MLPQPPALPQWMSGLEMRSHLETHRRDVASGSRGGGRGRLWAKTRMPGILCHHVSAASWAAAWGVDAGDKAIIYMNFTGSLI